MAALMTKILFWSVFATVLACIEIESEGKYGWADKAPTWYRTTGFWGRAYGMAMGGKPLTGYHAFMFFLPVMIFHVPFFMGVEWSIAAEFGAWALYFAWCPMWDYFWFVLNPAYKGKFKREHIWWHAKSCWVGGLFPIDYLVGVVISIVFAGCATWFAGSSTRLIEHLILLGGFGVYTMMLQVFAPLYRHWYAQMRKSDDRSKVTIFYR